MAKVRTKIGFSTIVETSPGVFLPGDPVEKTYSCLVLRMTNAPQTTENLNDDLRMSARLSIVADKYLNTNVGNMKYAVYLGSKWKITKIEVKYPRLLLTLGGLYNG